MDISKDLSDCVKAQSFLGILSIRNGLFFIAFTQVLFGVALYTILHYLHPSFIGAAIFLLALHILCAFLGFLGALKRSLTLETAYIVVYIISMAFVSMTALDLADLVHFLPRAPQIHDLSFYGMNLNPYFPLHHTPQFSLPTANLPFMLHKNAVLPNHGISRLQYIKEQVEPLAKPADASVPQPPVAKETFNAFINDKSTVAANKVSAGKNTTTNNDSAEGQKNTAPTDTTSVEKKEGGKNILETFYDNLPFVPHLGESEGETEEVSKDEFPPETGDLSAEGKSEVVVMYKLQKRPLKILASAFITLCFFFYLYCLWIVFTFVLNKGTDLDALTRHPEQFTPLIE